MPLCPYLQNLNGEGKSRAGLALGAQMLARQGLPGVLRQHGLGIERVDVRRPAIEEEVDDPLGLGREVRRVRRQRRSGLGLGQRPKG